MAMNPFPPQAYTQETLIKAFQWLQNQSPQIKALATTPDLLVSLYLKAQLQGSEALERPSLHNFKNELKSLAGMIGEFETTPAAEALTEAALTKMAHPSNQGAAPQGHPAGTQTSAAGNGSSPAGATSASTRSSTSRAEPTPRAEASRPAHEGAKPSSEHPLMELDSRSWKMIQEVKVQFNLSSEAEALRLMISTAHLKLKRFTENP